MAKTNVSTKIMIRTIIFFLIFTSCNLNTKPINKLNSSYEESNSSDPICGENVIWHVHLQNGFESDSIKFVFEQDTFPTLIATTNNNGCTNTFITCYRKNGEKNIFIKSLPNYNLVQKVVDQDQANDSIYLSILINEREIDFKEVLNGRNYFGLNYSKKNSLITHLVNDKCYPCR